MLRIIVFIIVFIIVLTIAFLMGGQHLYHACWNDSSFFPQQLLEIYDAAIVRFAAGQDGVSVRNYYQCFSFRFLSDHVPNLRFSVHFQRCERLVKDKHGCIVHVYGVKELTANSLIATASKFFPISNNFLV